MAQHNNLTVYAYHAGWIIAVLALLYHALFMAGAGHAVYTAIRVSPLNLLELSLLLLVFSAAHHAYRTGRS